MSVVSTPSEISAPPVARCEERDHRDNENDERDDRNQHEQVAVAPAAL